MYSRPSPLAPGDFWAERGLWPGSGRRVQGKGRERLDGAVFEFVAFAASDFEVEFLEFNLQDGVLD